MPHDLVIACVPNPVDGASALRQFVVNLFYGWGYNAYRQENKDRADDLLVRAEVSHWLTQARAEISRKESNFRRDHLKPPTRANPFPDPSAIEKVNAFARVQQLIETVEVAVRNAPVPENDHVWQRHRNEGDTLKRLMEADLDIAQGAIDLLREVSMEDFDPALPLRALPWMKAAMEARDSVLSIMRD